jgi:hypothetical protein
MTYMTDAPTAEHPVPMSGQGHGYDAPAGLSSGQYRLRRFGGRPIVFQGTELAMAMSFTPGLPYWFEINLFRANDGSCPVCVKKFFSSSEEKDFARAWVAPSIEAALDSIEAFDPAEDVPVRVSLSAGSMTPAEMEAAAMDLQAQVANVRTHYASLVGEFLHQLDAA